MKSAQIDVKRANVIKEIYKTEHDYLCHLKNLVEVSECEREREERIDSKIFDL